MAEYKVSMILDGGNYKLSYSKDGKQSKVTIGNEKNITVMAARRVCSEVEEMLQSDLTFDLLKKMRTINTDAEKCGYHSSVLKYQTVSIELVAKMLFPEKYEDFLNNEYSIIKNEEDPLEILSVGCTGSGKTRFILSAVLSPEALKNFVPALTSLRETTACSILYHINSARVFIQDGYDFRVNTVLKNEEEIRYSIKGLIIEAVEEYIVTVKENCKGIEDIEELCERCRCAVVKRLEMNYDKTFGLGIRKINEILASSIENLTKDALMGFYGSSKSIDKLAVEDTNYIIKQLVRDYADDQFNISSEDINTILLGFDYSDMVEQLYKELMTDLDKYNTEYSQNGQVGEEIDYSGNTEDPSTLMYLSHVFGNKSKQRKGEFYTIEPIVKSAEFFLKSNKISYDREVILSDSVGINQGQKDAARINEVVFNRVQESVQNRKPDLILYHTKINNKDDYMLDVVKKLNAQGYGKSTYIVAGRLDEVFTTYITDNFIEESDVNEEVFNDFITETKQIYVDSDVTLNSIIGSHYFMCDKTNKLADKHSYAGKYTCPNILEDILVEKLNVEQTSCQYNDVDFMQIIERNNVAGNVYQRFLDSIPSMIPLLYSKMRWNTLQKAIEELRWNGYGFDVLYPAFSIKNAIADELSSDEIKAEFVRLFGDDADEMKKRYLLEVADASQIVLVTEYRTFMKRLLDMRYDSSLRTNLGISMTDDRKHNLQRLYVGCLEQEGLKGAHTLKIVFHIAWIRTLDFFRRQAQFSIQAKL